MDPYEPSRQCFALHVEANRPADLPAEWAFVTYELTIGDVERLENGWFHPDVGGYPKIVVKRPVRSDTPGNALHEMLTLAHEFGHYVSLKTGRQ